MKNPEKQTDFREDVGKLLLDLGKLVFGGIILGGILRGGVSHVMLIASGSVVAVIFFIWGLYLTAKKKKENKE